MGGVLRCDKQHTHATGVHQRVPTVSQRGRNLTTALKQARSDRIVLSNVVLVSYYRCGAAISAAGLAERIQARADEEPMNE